MWEKAPKRFTDKKGSAMVLVVVTIVIISTLGLAILSLSVTNLKVSLVDKKATLSFYMAESGLEQAYEIILNDVKTAVIKANKVVNDRIKDFIAAERDLMLTNSSYKSAYIIGEDPNGPIDVDKLKEKLQTPTDSEYQTWLLQFQNKYKDVLIDSLVRDLNNPDNYEVIDSNVSTEKPFIKVESPPNPLFSGNNCTLTLSSLFDKEEYLQGKTVSQKVEMKFNIKVPSALSNTINVSTETETIDDNPIFNYAFITPESNMVFEGSDNGIHTNVKIKGNCYAYGAMGSATNLDGYGGFTVHKLNNDVSVTGDIAVYNVVQHKGKSGVESKNANLTVTGNIYARHVLINKNAENDTITVNGDVYTAEDLIMYGNDSHLTINGDWYATTADRKTDTSLSPNHPNSNLLVINGDKYIENVSLSIKNLTEMRRKQFANLTNYLDLSKYATEILEESPGEIFYISSTNSNKQVYLLGSNTTQKAPTKDIGLNVSGPTKGIIITKKDVRIYGKIDFSGLIISRTGCIHFNDTNVKEFKADRSYLLKKAYELKQAGKNPFKYTRPTGDDLPWPAEKQITITRATDVGVGDSVRVDPYKNLISVSDWRKL